jgi:hypothetical protein
MRLFLRVILAFVAVFAVLSVVRSLFAGSSRTPARRTSEAGKLVKDPVCGMYVVESSAIQAGGQFFCSDECRSKWGQPRVST